VAEFETLAGGARRIKANSCSFLFCRLEPGVFYTAIDGADNGEVKLSPLDEISAEHQRFGKPLAWFIDAENTTVVQGGGKKAEIEGRAALIRAEIGKTDSEYDRGVIGLGEPPVIAPGAAISNAVANAIGVRVPVLPLTPRRVLDALKGGKV